MRRALALLLAGAALAGCTLEPKDLRPAPPIPGALPAGGDYPAAAPGAAPISSVAWDAFFTDPRLKQVIALALRENRDLRVAALNVEAARARYRVQRADLLPTVALAGNATYGSSLFGGVGATTPTGPGGATGGTGVGSAGGVGGAAGGAGSVASGGSGFYRFYSVSLGFSSYELDLFGRIRSLTKEALQLYLATAEARRATQVSLISEVAIDWLTLAADQDRLAIARSTLESFTESLRLTQARFDAGIVSELDLRQVQTLAEGAASDIATYTTQVSQDVNALNLVVGASVDASLLPQGLGDGLPTVPEAPAGLDSAVLLRRPDVLQAERQLRAYNADIGAARAAFFPTISLTASGGSTSLYLDRLFGSGTGTYSFSPNLTLPIFDYGRNRANLKLSRTNREIALAQYERAIQTAFRETADALAQQGQVAALVGAQTRLVQSGETTLRLSDARYRRGADAYLGVLDAQRTVYAARQTLVAARQTRAATLVQIYRALGGGGDTPQPQVIPGSGEAR